VSNKYFILNLPDTALPAILANCVEDIDTLRKNNTRKKTVVKLPKGAKVPKNMKHFIEYSHLKILSEMAKPEWNPND